jgi:hypothetical protein
MQGKPTGNVKYHNMLELLEQQDENIQTFTYSVTFFTLRVYRSTQAYTTIINKHAYPKILVTLYIIYRYLPLNLFYNNTH